MNFDRQAALDAGYSEREIDSFLEKKPKKFDIKAAKEAGYSQKEIKEFLNKNKAYPHGVASFVQKHPKEALSGAAISTTIEPLEILASLSDPVSTGLRVAEGRGVVDTPVTDELKRMVGIEQLPEEAKTEASVLNFAASLLPIERLLTAGKAGAKSGLQGLRESEVVRSAPEVRAPSRAQADPFAYRDQFPLSKPRRPGPGEREFSLPVTRGSASQSLSGRASVGGKEVPVKPPSLPSTAISPLEDQVASIVSKQRFSNATVGGKAIQKEVMDLDSKVYSEVNDLYRKSRDLNKEIEAVHPELVQKLEERLAALREIPDPSGPEKQLISSMETLSKRLGSSSGYRPISNQTLIDQIQSLRKKIDYDFAHGDTSNIFKPLINDIQESVLQAAKKSPAAFNAFNDARRAYAEWADVFDSPYIRPLRNKTNKDYTKIFKGAQDIDEFNQLKAVLERSPNGKVISRGVQRELLLKKLKPIIEKQGKVSQKEVEEALLELDSFLSPEEVQAVREAISQSQQPITKEFFKRLDAKKVSGSELAMVASKLLKYLPIGSTPKKAIQMLLDPSARNEILKLVGQSNV